MAWEVPAFTHESHFNPNQWFPHRIKTHGRISFVIKFPPRWTSGELRGIRGFQVSIERFAQFYRNWLEITFNCASHNLLSCANTKKNFSTTFGSFYSRNSSENLLRLRHKPKLESSKCNCELLYRIPISFVSFQVEDAVHDGVHTAVGTGEQIQAFLKHDVSFLRFLRIHEKPFKAN